jgi:hypothetical protein
MRKPFLVSIDTRTIEALRLMATERGIVTETGPGAPLQRGNISGLLRQLADDYIASKRGKKQSKLSREVLGGQGNDRSR